jgi:hypothetical protein
MFFNIIYFRSNVRCSGKGRGKAYKLTMAAKINRK